KALSGPAFTAALHAEPGRVRQHLMDPVGPSSRTSGAIPDDETEEPMPTKILVVEDDRAIRRGLVDALKFAGYDTVDAGDGEEGLVQALVPGIDLVLLDVLMPKRDGFSVLEELRRSRPGLPVIVLTAKGAEEDRVRGLKGGADDYVVKPFSANELLARV